MISSPKKINFLSPRIVFEDTKVFVLGVSPQSLGCMPSNKLMCKVIVQTSLVTMSVCPVCGKVSLKAPPACPEL